MVDCNFERCSLSRAELEDDSAPIPTAKRNGIITGPSQLGNKLPPSAAFSTAHKHNEDLKLWLEQVLERHQTAMLSMLLNHQGPVRHLESVTASSAAPVAELSFWKLPGPPAVDSRDNGIAGRNSSSATVTTNDRKHVDIDLPRPSPMHPGTLLADSGTNIQDSKRSLSSLRCSRSKITKVFKETVDQRIEAIVKNVYFDYVMGMIILGNMVCMFVQLEWEGYKGSVFLGLEVEDRTAWSGAEVAFLAFEELFTITYLLEFVIRLYFFKLAYFRDVANILDALVVLSSTVDTYVIRFTHEAHSEVGKLIKVCRVVRVLKIMRILTKFAELRVLMRACAESVSVFLWSMLLALVVIVAGAIFMSQLSTMFINDLSYPEDLRLWLHQYYGTCSKASYTMFEVTFSGGWPSRTRETVEQISWLFAIFWILYVMLIHFALTRLVAAMFLKQTMAVAATDKERSVMEKMKKLTITLKELFMEADTSNDGFLSTVELDTALGFSHVKTMLEDVDISIPELRHLFELLADVEGKVDMKTFVDGALRLKGTLRATDAISLAHEQRKLQRGIILLGEGLEHLFEHLDTHAQWRFRRSMALTTPRMAHMQPTCSPHAAQ